MSPFFWLGLTGIIIWAAAWLITHWPYRELRNKFPALHERPMTNTFAWFAVFLFPFWLWLIVLTLRGTFALWFTEPPVGPDHALAYRVHYLALVGLMTALAGLVGAPLAIHRLYTVERQTKAQEEGLITDRINKAVEGLGTEKSTKRVIETPKYLMKDGNWVFNDEGIPIPIVDKDHQPVCDRDQVEESVPNLEVRIGAIYALERIAKHNLDEHIQIMEILAAYVRENARVSTLEPREPPFDREVPRADIQAAISVMGRRSEKQKLREKSAYFRLDLRDTDLAGVDFTGGDFSAAKLHSCRLEGAIFRDCDLSGTQFFGSLINFASFENANLYATRFENTKNNRPKVAPGILNRSIIAGNIYGINISSADMTALNYLGNANVKIRIFGSKDTLLHYSIGFEPDENERLRDAIFLAQEENRIDDAAALQAELDGSGFSFWSPYDNSDLATGQYYKEFLDALEIEGWPYRPLKLQ